MFKSCSVFGHSEIEVTEELKQCLEETFEFLITCKNVNVFYFGGLGEFDFLCWQVVTELKKQYPYIKRIFCLCNNKQQKKFAKMSDWINNENYEEIIYFQLEFDYWYTRIYYRNCEIIKCSDYVVFYVEHFENSGAYKALKYAKKLKKQIINVKDNNLMQDLKNV